MHSLTIWKLARSPNYKKTNVDKKYPYSELPYVGGYKLVKIPTDEGFINHVDYWGEGLIITELGTSGFADCYNVNHEYQLVSNGPDRGRKIPNRIPVFNYDNCDTSAYIKEHSVKIVTLMGAPINKSCASDIARIVNADIGKVVIYGFDENSEFVKNINEELGLKGLVYCDGYDHINLRIQRPTLFDTYRVYLNLKDIREELYKSVSSAIHSRALNITEATFKNGYGLSITDAIQKTLFDGIRTAMEYVFKLKETTNGPTIIENCLPSPLKIFVNNKDIKIMNKTKLLAIKLAEATGVDKQVSVIANGKDNVSSKLKWKFVPQWEGEDLNFVIKNIEQNKYLKLVEIPNDVGNRKAVASSSDTGKGSIWFLIPSKLGDDIVFNIVNKEYNQILKLDDAEDSSGNRLLWGHSASIDKNSQFAWYIEPFD